MRARPDEPGLRPQPTSYQDVRPSSDRPRKRRASVAFDEQYDAEDYRYHQPKGDNYRPRPSRGEAPVRPKYPESPYSYRAPPSYPYTPPQQYPPYAAPPSRSYPHLSQRANTKSDSSRPATQSQAPFASASLFSGSIIRNGRKARMLLPPFPLNSSDMDMDLFEIYVNNANLAQYYGYTCDKLRPKENEELFKATEQNNALYQLGDVIESNFPEILQDRNIAAGSPARADGIRESVFIGPHQEIIRAITQNVTGDDVYEVLMCGTSHGDAYDYALEIAREDPDAVALVWRKDVPLREDCPDFLEVIYVDPIAHWPSAKGTIVDFRRSVPVRTNIAMRRVACVSEPSRDSISRMLSVQHDRKEQEWNASKGLHRSNDGSDMSINSNTVAGAQEENNISKSVHAEPTTSARAEQESEFRVQVVRALNRGADFSSIQYMIAGYLAEGAPTSPIAAESPSSASDGAHPLKMPGDTGSKARNVAEEPLPRSAGTIPQDQGGQRSGSEQTMSTAIQHQLIPNQSGKTLASLLDKTNDWGFNGSEVKAGTAGGSKANNSVASSSGKAQPAPPSAAACDKSKQKQKTTKRVPVIDPRKKSTMNSPGR